MLTVFRAIASVLVFAGALLEFEVAWSLGDILMGLSPLINLPVIVILGKKAVDCLKDYQAQRKVGKDPQFVASSIGLDPGSWTTGRTRPPRCPPTRRSGERVGGADAPRAPASSIPTRPGPFSACVGPEPPGRLPRWGIRAGGLHPARSSCQTRMRSPAESPQAE